MAELFIVGKAARMAENVTDTWPHDVPGFMMMPIGMLLLWIEWNLISKLFIEEPADRAAAIARKPGVASDGQSRPQEATRRSGAPPRPRLATKRAGVCVRFMQNE